MDSRLSGGIGGAAQGAAIGSAFGPIGTGIGAVAGGLAGVLSGGGEDEAEKLGRIQAEQIRQAAAENKRRRLLEMESILGYTRAATYASNLLDSGSSKRYRSNLESNYRSEMAWDMQKARIDARMAEKGGQNAASAIQSMGMNSMLGGISSLAGSGLFKKSPSLGKTSGWAANEALP